jgi:hypothetical protein
MSSLTIFVLSQQVTLMTMTKRFPLLLLTILALALTSFGEANRAVGSEQEVITKEVSEADADAMFAKGEEAFNNVSDKDETSERDVKYEEAYQYANKAMQYYMTLAENKPDDEALSEKIIKCNKLRYTILKKKRFH